MDARSQITKTAKVKKSILFHHDVAHADKFVDRLERKEFKESNTSYEGMELNF